MLFHSKIIDLIVKTCQVTYLVVRKIMNFILKQFNPFVWSEGML